MPSTVLLSLVVCLSVCPSVPLVDQEKSWTLIGPTISTTHLLFVAQRSSAYSQVNSL